MEHDIRTRFFVALALTIPVVLYSPIGHNLFGVKLKGSLEAPRPLRVSGKATFEILWCDFSVSFNKTLVDGGPLNSSVPIDATSVLQQALSDPHAWRAELPPAASQLVTVRTDATGGVLLHHRPLTVRQSMIPLNLTRDRTASAPACPRERRAPSPAPSRPVRRLRPACRRCPGSRRWTTRRWLAAPSSRPWTRASRSAGPPADLRAVIVPGSSPTSSWFWAIRSCSRPRAADR